MSKFGRIYLTSISYICHSFCSSSVTKTEKHNVVFLALVFLSLLLVKPVDCPCWFWRYRKR